MTRHPARPALLRQLLLACALLLSALLLGTLPGRAQERLNVVFILADDLGWGEVGAYGQRKIPTPHIDRLAAQGLRFTQHYSGAPVCAPSRAVLMTGRHLGRAEVRGNMQARVRFPQFDEGQYPLSAGAATLAQAFQRAGYATGAMGKWGLGPVGSTGDPNRKGFDLFFGYNDQAVAHSYYPPHLWRNAEKITINRKPIPGHAKQPTGTVTMEDWIGEAYAPALMVAEAERFVATHAERPFFLYLPFIEPHVAMHPPRAAVERFPEAWDTEVYRGENNYLPHPRPRAAYAAMIADLDAHVGRVLAALERAGVADRTLVVFTSDNGATHPGRVDGRFHVGGADPPFFDSTAGLRGYKGSVYEGGIRVPAIARLPGRIAAGAVNATPGYFADWFPTLAEAAGLPAPDDVDGQSLWSVLTGRAATLDARRPMIWVFPEYGGQVAVRHGDLKFVRQGLKTSTPGPWEVYDLAADPGESRDLAASRGAEIRAVEAILRREVKPNEAFPLEIPGVTDAGAGPGAATAAGQAPRDAHEMHGLHRDPKAYIAALDDPARDVYQKPQEVLQALDLRTGEVIADIGAGSGYFSTRLAHHVGPAGRVYAVDVSPDMITHLQRRVRDLRLLNVSPILAPADDPLLPEPVDRVLIVNVWHHVERQAEYLERLKKALKPGGQIVMIDFHKRELPVGPPAAMKIAREDLLGQMQTHGFRLAKEHTFLPYQYFLVFEPAR